MRNPYRLLVVLLVSLSAAAAPDLTELEESFPQIAIDRVEPSGADGIWELIDTRGQIFYLTDDGEHLFAGELLNVRSRRSLTEERRRQMRATVLQRAPNDLLSYPAAQPEHQVTVVTDIDCTYCRLLHQQIAEYNEAGISVEYLIMPRAGLESASYDKAVDAVCADRPAEAFTAAMAGESIAPADCAHSVADQFGLARQLGVTGTPAIVFADGAMVNGYVPPRELSARLTGDYQMRTRSSGGR